MRLVFIPATLLTFLAPTLLAAKAAPPFTVAKVDLTRYSGTWYEIAAIPQPFEQGCVGSMASYEVTGENQLRVTNSCHKGSADGPLETVEGYAIATDATGAKLKVTFGQPPSANVGDYWILALDPNYQFALVGSPDRGSLWILDRSSHPSAAVVAKLTDTAADAGFDVSKLRLSPQP